MATQWRATVDAVIELQGGELDARPAPGLQWFPSQWLGDAAVQLMGWTARGLHHHLLMVSWKGFDLDDDAIPASLPDDMELLAAICQHPDGWDDLWRQIARAWKLYEGRWWNLGLCRSYLAQMKKRAKAKSSADARWGQEHANASPGHANASLQHANAPKTDAPESPRECSSSSSSPSSSDPEEERAAEDAVAPLSVFGDLLTEREKISLADLMAGDPVDPATVVSLKLTDEDRMRMERLYLLASMERRTRSAVGEADSAFELWATWRRAARDIGRKKGAEDWSNEVQCLRPLLDKGRKGAEILRALGVTGSWRRFDWSFKGAGNGGRPTGKDEQLKGIKASTAGFRRNFERQKAEDDRKDEEFRRNQE